ncbi:MAG: hypothetical protein A2Y38_05705 [Spirochaetes bacterium GWB1_59_5]|nr:MAG: hypothetical protein A2Y38_05705 [Spirochaetes bacterium GWB1_59_5]
MLLALPALLALPVKASSQQAYQDYLYQLDVYRQTHTDFQVAKNEYEKFQSLTSESTALAKTITMLGARDMLLKSYLFLLNEKLNEDRGLSQTEKQLYQTVIGSEVKFLAEHAGRIPSIGSLEDATVVSRELESHYIVLHASLRRTIAGLVLGNLAIQSRQFDSIVASAKALVGANRGAFALDKQAIMDRWMLQIDNKRSLYQQKINAITSANTKLTGNSLDDIDRNFTKILKDAGEAKQYLIEGTSYMGELITALKYQD